MRRNTELVKRILEILEEEGPQQVEAPYRVTGARGYSFEEVEYHAMLCSDQGFVVADREEGTIRLTWGGHDELERMRRAERP